MAGAERSGKKGQNPGPHPRHSGRQTQRSPFRLRMRGQGIFADQISQMFHIARRMVGLPEDGPELSTAAFRRPEGAQLALGLSAAMEELCPSGRANSAGRRYRRPAESFMASAYGL